MSNREDKSISVSSLDLGDGFGLIEREFRRSEPLADVICQIRDELHHFDWPDPKAATAWDQLVHRMPMIFVNRSLEETVKVAQTMKGFLRKRGQEAAALRIEQELQKLNQNRSS